MNKLLKLISILILCLAIYGCSSQTSTASSTGALSDREALAIFSGTKTGELLGVTEDAGSLNFSSFSLKSAAEQSSSATSLSLSSDCDNVPQYLNESEWNCKSHVPYLVFDHDLDDLVSYYSIQFENTSNFDDDNGSYKNDYYIELYGSDAHTEFSGAERYSTTYDATTFIKNYTEYSYDENHELTYFSDTTKTYDDGSLSDPHNEVYEYTIPAYYYAFGEQQVSVENDNDGSSYHSVGDHSVNFLDSANQTYASFVSRGYENYYYYPSPYSSSSDTEDYNEYLIWDFELQVYDGDTTYSYLGGFSLSTESDSTSFSTDLTNDDGQIIASLQLNYSDEKQDYVWDVYMYDENGSLESSPVSSIQ